MIFSTLFLRLFSLLHLSHRFCNVKLGFTTKIYLFSSFHNVNIDLLLSGKEYHRRRSELSEHNFKSSSAVSHIISMEESFK